MNTTQNNHLAGSAQPENVRELDRIRQLIQIAQRSEWKCVSDDIGEFDYQRFIDWLQYDRNCHIKDLADATSRFETRAIKAEKERDSLLAQLDELMAAAKKAAKEIMWQIEIKEGRHSDSLTQLNAAIANAEKGGAK